MWIKCNCLNFSGLHLKSAIGDAGNEETEKEMETAVTVVPWSSADTIGTDTMGASELQHLWETHVNQSASRLHSFQIKHLSWC